MTEEDQLLLNELKTKVQHLFKGFNQLEDENKKLHGEINELREKIETLKSEKLEIGRANEQLKIANRLLSGNPESSEAKQKINILIREIDKCIALLNR